MRKTEKLAYTAGVVDGEGSIILHCPDKRYNNLRIRVSVTNTAEWLVQWLKFQYGGSIQREIGKGNNKTAYHWCIFSNKALEFLKLILPYLNLKHPQAELAIKVQEAKRVRATRKRTDEERAVEQAQHILMKEFNKRGNKDAS